MAVGRVSCSSYENQIKQLQVTFSHTLLKYEGYIEYTNDNKVKWSGGLVKLKSFVVDLFGDEGKWSSPGGSAKLFQSNWISITWYANTESILFQGELGIKLKELIENSSKNRTTTNLINKSDESKRYDRLFDELIEVKQSVANMSSAMNKLYDHVSFTVNYINSQDLTSKKTVSECGIQTDIYPMSTNLAHINNQGTILKNAVSEIGIQTDVNPVNENLTQNKVKESIPISFYELSTDLEGTKLDIVIMERKVASGVRENGQAIDQIRAEFADIRDDQQKAAQRDKAIIELLSKQNSALSDKVNTLSLDLEKLKANLHKAEQKHVSDHPTQRCVHIVAKTTKGHESENLLLQQISEKQVNTPVDSCGILRNPDRTRTRTRTRTRRKSGLEKNPDPDSKKIRTRV